MVQDVEDPWKSTEEGLLTSPTVIYFFLSTMFLSISKRKWGKENKIRWIMHTDLETGSQKLKSIGYQNFLHEKIEQLNISSTAFFVLSKIVRLLFNLTLESSAQCRFVARLAQRKSGSARRPRRVVDRSRSRRKSHCFAGFQTKLS